MNGDLEATLAELGPEYRAVVARLRAAQGAEGFLPSDAEGLAPSGAGRGCAHRGLGLQSKALRPALVAASLLALAGLGSVWLWRRGAGRAPAGADAAVPAAREYLLAVMGGEASMREMIATQNPDGSWQNDFLTRRNAASLKLWGERCPVAQVAYKKAARNLRVRGL